MPTSTPLSPKPATALCLVNHFVYLIPHACRHAFVRRAGSMSAMLDGQNPSPVLSEGAPQNTPASAPANPPANAAENRTFVGSIVFIDIVDYSKKTVAEQILIRERFKSLMTASLKGIDPELRLVLDTGDGAAISFLGDMQDALTVSMRMRDYLIAANGAPVADTALVDLDRTIPIFNYALRIGINLGPVKLQQDNHGHPQIVGDGINVAQRITSFANADQIVVSQSYFDAVSAISADYKKLLSYEGSRTDKNVRDHEIYVVGEAVAIAGLINTAGSDKKSKPNSDADAKAGKNPSEHAASLGHDKQPRDERKSTSDAGSSNKRTSASAASTSNPPPFMRDRNKLLLTGSVLAFVVAGLFLTLLIRKPNNKLIAKTNDSSEDLVRYAVKTDAANTVAATLAPAPAGAASSEPAAAPPILAAPAPNTPENQPPNSAAATPATLPASALPPVAEEKSSAVAVVAAKPIVKPAAKPAITQGTVSFSIQPWGDVYVNGRSIGASPPLKQTKLAPGTYKVEIKNTTFPSYVTNVDVKSREDVSIKHKF